MITINDVARRAGVTISTVSKVFNNYSGVSKDTREKVVRAAKELGYIPSKTAMELSRGVQPYIGLIVNNLSTNSAKDEYLFRLISGVQERVSEHDLDLTLFTKAQINKKDYTYVELCKHHRLVGVILHGIGIKDPYLKELLNSPLPCVLIDMEHKGMNTAFISTDNINAAKDVVNLLYGKGYTKLCHILGTADAAVTKRRKEGFLAAAAARGIVDATIINGEFNEQVAYTNTKAALKQGVNGIFASSDIMALGAMRAITEAGLKPGHDIGLVGFDGLTTLEYTSPSITTVLQDFHGMGRAAVDTLLKIANNQPYDVRAHVPYKLVERESV